jgi:hypothetical protein
MRWKAHLLTSAAAIISTILADVCSVQMNNDECTCLNWKDVYAAHEAQCGQGMELYTPAKRMGLPWEQVLPFVERELCDDFFERLDTNACVPINLGAEPTVDAWAAKAWCYVPAGCDDLQGGGAISGSTVRWKVCHAGPVDAFLEAGRLVPAGVVSAWGPLPADAPITAMNEAPSEATPPPPAQNMMMPLAPEAPLVAPQVLDLGTATVGRGAAATALATPPIAVSAVENASPLGDVQAAVELEVNSGAFGLPAANMVPALGMAEDEPAPAMLPTGLAEQRPAALAKFVVEPKGSTDRPPESELRTWWAFLKGFDVTAFLEHVLPRRAKAPQAEAAQGFMADAAASHPSPWQRISDPPANEDAVKIDPVDAVPWYRRTPGAVVGGVLYVTIVLTLVGASTPELGSQRRILQRRAPVKRMQDLSFLSVGTN